MREPELAAAGNPVPNPYAVLNLPAGTICGVLTVPENRAVPNGRRIQLGVAVAKATSPHPKRDPIVYLTGGPGGSAIVTAVKQIKEGLNRDRDVIFVDQRGEYHSDPALTCPEIDDRFTVQQLGLSVLAASTKVKDLAAVKACHDRLVAQGYDLSAYNTPENAADIADLRVAMGIKRWNVYGVSYGTDLALQLLRDYPQGIRSVVLDSLVPPQVNLIDQFWPSAAQGYHALFKACAAQRACHRAYPRLAAQFTTAVNRLAKHPLTVELPASAGQPAIRVVIDGYTLANLVVVLSLSPGNYAGLPQMIHEIAIGNGTSVAQTLVTNVTGTPAGLAAYGLSFGVFCREGVGFTNQATELAAARKALPGFSKSVLSLVPQATRIIPECRLWNVGRADRSAFAPTRSNVHTLLLNGTLDAVTPPSQAYLAARTLSRSSVVPIRGFGHDTFDVSSCARSITLGFFDKPNGGYDTTCAKRLKDPTFMAARSARHSRFDPQEAALVGQLARAGLGGGITGITVGISDRSLGHLVRSYGTADVRGTRLTPDMYYRIASVTKTFTADAVLQLVAEGKVRLGARLSSYVSGIPRGSAITVRDLLAMRGGVYDFTNDKGFGARYARNPLLPGWNPNDVLKIVRRYPRRAKAPNRATVYSNSEYVLLGYVIQKASGESAPRYIKSIIRQLGLGQTSFPAGARLPRPFAHGYVGPGSITGKRADADVTFSNPLVPWTAGAMISTVPDMLKYARELGTGAGLPPRLWRLRRNWGALTKTGVRLQYGLGLTRLGDWIGHDGSIFGYSDLVFYLPSRHASVVVMANAADGNTVPAQVVWGEIVKHLYPGTLPQWP